MANNNNQSCRQNENEWQTLTQAAKAFGHTRQAIESLVKRGVIEAKPLAIRMCFTFIYQLYKCTTLLKSKVTPQINTNQDNNQFLGQCFLTN